jgi:heme/copper-type cytochrome/quinol oxidase subunit 4
MACGLVYVCLKLRLFVLNLLLSVSPLNIKAATVVFMFMFSDSLVLKRITKCALMQCLVALVHILRLQSSNVETVTVFPEISVLTF